MKRQIAFVVNNSWVISLVCHDGGTVLQKVNYHQAKLWSVFTTEDSSRWVTIAKSQLLNFS